MVKILYPQKLGNHFSINLKKKFIQKIEFFVEKSSVGKEHPGTIGMLAALIPLFAKYIHVGVFEVLETLNKIISALSKLCADCPLS